MIQVIHTPSGHEHPYEQRPEERFPRHPLAGEAFEIGIAIRPSQAMKSVIVHSEIDGIAQEQVQAEFHGAWQPELEHGVGAEYLERIEHIDQDIWRAKLIAPPMGKQLRYWIEADNVSTKVFSIVGECWQPTPELTVPIRHVFGPDDDMLHPRRIDYLTDGNTVRRVRMAFPSSVEERFYGLGERFNALNQRGNVMDIRCFEQYKSQGHYTYMPIPFLLSSAGYGLWVNSTRWMQFDLAASSDTGWVLEADIGDDGLELHWFSDDDPFKIIGRFATKTGPVQLPPLWAFGLWMSGNEWNSQKRVEQEVHTSLKHHIQPSVIVLEAWSDETTFYIWNDAEYDTQSGDYAFQYEDFRFPPDGKWTDPKGMVDGLHSQDIRVLLWQVPVFKDAQHQHPQHQADKAYFEEHKLGIQEPDGSLHRLRPFWFRGGYIWDVTNPQARAWWLNKRAYLLEDIGIDGFKTDGGEHLWGESTVFSDGRLGAEVWNEYPQLYSEAYYQFANQHKEAITFSRAGHTGSQRAPLHWAGDENSTWDAFRHSILAGLSAGISGIPFWGWDLGGFSGAIPSSELYLRSAAMAAFCPVMQYHSEFNNHQEPNADRTPWNIQDRTGDERVIDIFRFFVNVRHNLMPYIWQEATYSAATGEPMMRAIRLLDTEASPYHYMFGRDLLVCPIVEAGTRSASIYLPNGIWFDLWTKKQYVGGQIVSVEAPLDRIPIFARNASEIPVSWGAHKQLGEFVPLSSEPNASLKFR